MLNVPFILILFAMFGLDLQLILNYSDTQENYSREILCLFDCPKNNWTTTYLYEIRENSIEFILQYLYLIQIYNILYQDKGDNKS